MKNKTALALAAATGLSLSASCGLDFQGVPAADSRCGSECTDAGPDISERDGGEGGMDAGPDGLNDGGPVDAGHDADAGNDSGVMDAGVDADAGMMDAGVDAGPMDAGPDGGMMDAGPMDAGVDSGVDGGPMDAGMDADAGIVCPGITNDTRMGTWSLNVDTQIGLSGVNARYIGQTSTQCTFEFRCIATGDSVIITGANLLVGMADTVVLTGTGKRVNSGLTSKNGAACNGTLSTANF